MLAYRGISVLRRIYAAAASGGVSIVVRGFIGAYTQWSIATGSLATKTPFAMRSLRW